MFADYIEINSIATVRRKVPEYSGWAGWEHNGKWNFTQKRAM